MALLGDRFADSWRRVLGLFSYKRKHARNDQQYRGNKAKPGKYGQHCSD